MPTFELETIIHAPIERVFDLARSIEAHMDSTLGTQEKAIAGVTSGLINENETVSWGAKHFGVKHHLTAKITKMNRPHFFEDQMLKGIFAHMRHEHHFTEKEECVLMKDVFDFKASLSVSCLTLASSI